MPSRRELADAVAAQIREAFAGVQLGNGIGLREAQGIDDYAMKSEVLALRATDEKLDWRRIPASELNQCNSSLSFFDAEGMRFHLPAYLLADLDGSYEWMMSFCLTNVSALGEEQFSLLSAAQRDAVRAFLRYIAGEENYASEASKIASALAGYWSK